MSNSTYLNCYELVEQVALDLDIISDPNHVEDFVEGLDITPRYKLSQVIRKINNAQRFLYALLFQRIPDVFKTSTTITGVNSVYALPWNFGKLIEFQNSNGSKIYPTDITRSNSGNKREYYRKGMDLILTTSGVTDTYTLWHYTKCRDLTTGKASAEDTLASSAKAIADYYNGMIIENVTDGEYDEITDYTAARAITHTETLDADDFYGLVSELPEPFHFLISQKAIIDIKASSVKSIDTPKEFSFFNDQLIETFRAFAGSSEDITMEDIFCDFGPLIPTKSRIIAIE